MKYRAFLTLQEAVYAGNIGFLEMVKFYRKATEDEIEEMEKYISGGNWRGFRSIIKKVLGIELKEGQNVRLGYAGDTKTFIGGRGEKDDEEEE